ncbi:MAG: CDP-glucose 4,6-dehydratase [Alphaproteobacteria bacterium]|nr:CDP-glucose 4,6-dehydratase [Alphaproteobacteria bacterium]
MFAGCYKNRRVLLTGHTGFKGSWLALWLQNLGAEVTGVALDPETRPNHWDLLKLDMAEERTDIRDYELFSKTVKNANPEIVFHLAAQALVRRSCFVSRETWETNVMGTVNLLESCRDTSVKAIVVVTTDKCYENLESAKGYTEEDRLGGHDPYSAAKASAALAAASYRDSIFKGKPLVATARAGNVIGGGDWAEDRLIPDLMRARENNKILEVRSPAAVRPWQHVLEPLAGYLQLGRKLLEGDKKYEGAWNFGPDETLSVADLLKRMGAEWKSVPGSGIRETGVLKLDSAKAQKNLNWKPVLPMEEQIAMTAEWYSAFYEKKSVISRQQLEYYESKVK